MLELCELRTIDPTVPILVFLAKPRVQEGIPGSDPLAGVLYEQLLHKVFRGHRYVLPLPVTELILTLHILVQDFIRAVALEKRTASQNDIKDDSNTKDVSLTVVTLFLEELRGDVARAAAPQIQLFRLVFDHGGQAEVRNLQVPVVLLRGEEQVLWLQIPMYNVFGVQVLECTDKVLHHGPCVRLSVQALALDLVEELAAFKVRQEQMDVLGCLVGLIQLDHILMVNFTQHVYLSKYGLLKQSNLSQYSYKILDHAGPKTYNIALALVESRLLHCLERILSVLVSFARAQVDLREVTVAKEPANDKLLLQIEQDHEPLHSVYPIISLQHRVHVEVYGAPPGHNNEAVEVLLRGVLEVVLLQPAVLDV